MKKAGDIVKETIDTQLKEYLSNSNGLFLFKYTGVNSVDLTSLRRNLSTTGARMLVTKNSFINAVLKSINKEKEILDFISGPVAMVFIKDDPVSPTKVLTEFAKTHETIQLKGGFISERVIFPQDFKVLASIPPKQVLYQQVAAALNGPVTKLAMSLNQIIAKLAYALKAVSDKKQKEDKK